MASWRGTTKLWCRLLRACLPRIGNKWIYDNRTTTNPHNPLYILHSCTECLSRTPGSHSVCAIRTLFTCGSVAEHWRLKPEVSWARLLATAGLFTFSLFHLIWCGLLTTLMRTHKRDSWPRNLMLSWFHLQVYKGWTHFLGKNLFPCMDEKKSNMDETSSSSSSSQICQ